MFEKEGKNLDTVMIATPDHMHTPVALLAMRQGKHVYCEKPLVRTAWEAPLLADAAVKYRVATQMGNQGWNHEGTKTVSVRPTPFLTGGPGSSSDGWPPRPRA